MTAADAPRRRGRANATSKDVLGGIGLDLLIARGYAGVTVEEIADAAGISRRTFFRYFASKNDLAWGDFDALLGAFRSSLADQPPSVSTVDAVRAAVVAFNDVPAGELPRHRERMRILLTTPELVADSTLRYADWRRVIADFVAARLTVSPDAPVAQAVSWACLGISLSAYRSWIADDDADLLDLIEESFDGLGAVFASAALHPAAAGS
jgi:TetR/AcrR family transcriptional regulator, regulator of mycofactocin system